MQTSVKKNIPTKFNVQLTQSDSVEIRRRADALGWSTSALIRRLIESFVAGEYKLSRSNDDKKIIEKIFE